MRHRLGGFRQFSLDDQSQLTNHLTDGAPTVAGSHMTQPRQSTPGRTFPRVRAADERPGDVSLNPEFGMINKTK